MAAPVLDLKVRLTLRVAALAALCYLAAVICVLYATNRTMRERTDSLAEIVTADLVLQSSQRQWLKSAAERPLDLQVLSQTVREPGLCIVYREAGGEIGQRLCDGVPPADTAVPPAFAALYTHVFGFGTQSVRIFRLDKEHEGEAVASIDGERVIAEGWRQTSGLIAILAATWIALCLLTYAMLAYALRPSRMIRAGLQRLAAGDLSARLPPFDLAEMSPVSTVFNSLAGGLDQALAERRSFKQRLIAVQDDERRHLARELHDEFGQCLAAINAMAFSASQTAQYGAPQLLPEIDHITHTVGHMMDILRGTLLRLRAPEIEELGLVASLEGLVASWNGRDRETHYAVEWDGRFDAVSTVLAANIYRIAQEAITNAAKHAHASNVLLHLSVRQAIDTKDAEQIDIRIDDNGQAGEQPDVSAGLGLLGIRERVEALGGQFAIEVLKPSGLGLRVRIPLPAGADWKQRQREPA
jgi:signal transduction histidine kinase